MPGPNKAGTGRDTRPISKLRKDFEKENRETLAKAKARKKKQSARAAMGGTAARVRAGEKAAGLKDGGRVKRKRTTVAKRKPTRRKG